MDNLPDDYIEPTDLEAQEKEERKDEERANEYADEVETI